MPTDNDDASRLAEIAERESKATPGPWLSEVQDGRRNGAVSTMAEVTSLAWVNTTGESRGICTVWDRFTKNNRDFIAHSREDIPFLLAAIKRRDEEIARLQPNSKPATNMNSYIGNQIGE